MSVYFNEIDPFCCRVIRKNFPDATVDERDICDVQPDDVVGYEQVHWFAGIGGFELACQLAGWRGPLWTGGFPCQGVSAAGKGAGMRDERSALWWRWFHLIDACRPDRLLIENVPLLKTRGADRVLFALEGIGYACWPLVVGAEHVGAPHKRHRVWIVADRIGGGIRGGGLGSPGGAAGGVQGEGDERQRVRPDDQSGGETRGRGDVADADGDGQSQSRGLESGGGGWSSDEGRQDVADATRQRTQGHGSEGQQEPAVSPEEGLPGRDGGGMRWPAHPGQEQHEWEQRRLVEFPVGCDVDGLPARLVRRANKDALKAYGNAIVPQVAAEVLKSWMDAVDTEHTQKGEA